MRKPYKTEREQIDFFEQCCDRYRAAATTVGTAHFDCRVAGTKVRLRFAGERLVPLLTPALAHLQVPAFDAPDLTLLIWDSESTGVKMVPPPCARNCFTDRGDIWGFNSRRIKTAFHWIENSVNVMDLEQHLGVFWVQTIRSVPFWVYASPLRTLFHWWMEKQGCQLLHAAAVGTDDGAILITGKGGSGKSTTAMTCLEAGLYYAADDYLIVATDPRPMVHSLYSTAKLNAEDVAFFDRYREFIRNPNKLDREKAVMFLYPPLEDQLRDTMPLRAIFSPQVVNQERTEISPIPYWTIQRALAFTTMSQLPGVGRHTHEFFNRLCEGLPFYRLSLGSRRERIPKVIESYLDAPPPFEPENAWASRTTGQKPLVSVIIPVYNGERFIKSAIEHVCAQNYPALELIVVDDGSTDDTAEIVESVDVDVRFFRQDNLGPAAARNRGLKDASGEFIFFLDADDYWPANTVNMLVEHILNDDVDIVRGYAQVVLEIEGQQEVEFRGNPKESFADYIGAAVYRKSVFNAVGLFDPGLLFGEDADWFVRARECQVNMRRIEDVTLYVRRHGDNMTEDKSLVELNTLRVFKKALDRRRLLQNSTGSGP